MREKIPGEQGATETTAMHLDNCHEALKDAAVLRSAGRTKKTESATAPNTRAIPVSDSAPPDSGGQVLIFDSGCSESQENDAVKACVENDGKQPPALEIGGKNVVDGVGGRGRLRKSGCGSNPACERAAADMHHTSVNSCRTVSSTQHVHDEDGGGTAHVAPDSAGESNPTNGRRGETHCESGECKSEHDDYDGDELNGEGEREDASVTSYATAVVSPTPVIGVERCCAATCWYACTCSCHTTGNCENSATTTGVTFLPTNNVDSKLRLLPAAYDRSSMTLTALLSKQRGGPTTNSTKCSPPVFPAAGVAPGTAETTAQSASRRTAATGAARGPDITSCVETRKGAKDGLFPCNGVGNEGRDSNEPNARRKRERGQDLPPSDYPATLMKCARRVKQSLRAAPPSAPNVRRAFLATSECTGEPRLIHFGAAARFASTRHASEASPGSLQNDYTDGPGVGVRHVEGGRR